MYTDVQASGRSAVFHGAENYLEIVKLLIQGGADLHVEDKVSPLVFNQSKHTFLTSRQHIDDGVCKLNKSFKLPVLKS